MVFHRARIKSNKKTLNGLYYTFVYHYLIYGVEILGNSFKKYLEPLCKVQKKIIRIIIFSPYLSPTKTIFKKLNILTLYKLVKSRIILLMFKRNENMLPSLLNTFFTSNNAIHTHNTRNKEALRNQFGNTEIMYRTFSYHGIKL